MFKVKNIAVAAGSAFVLSFLISAISTHRIGVSLLRGLIFALVFAALSVAIDFLNSKFLEVEGGIAADIDEGARKGQSGNSSGSFVNITIDDENLTEEDQAPAFDVSSGRQVFSYKAEPRVQSVPETSPAPESVPASATESAPVESTGDAAPAPQAEFKPVQLGTPIAEGETVKNDAPQPEAETAKKATGVKEIDALPDIGEFSSQDNDIGDSNPVASVINDSEFAQSGDMRASAAMTEGGDMMKQDSKIIASAIRTLLKKED